MLEPTEVVVQKLATCRLCHSDKVAWVRVPRSYRTRLVDVYNQNGANIADTSKPHMCKQGFRDPRVKDDTQETV